MIWTIFGWMNMRRIFMIKWRSIFEVARGGTGGVRGLERGQGHGTSTVEYLCCVQDFATADTFVDVEI